MDPGEFTALHRGGSGEPLVLVHGFTDTWRGWELVLPALEAEHEVLAPTLAGHSGGPPIGADVDPEEAVVAAVERAMDAAGFETAHLAGNSLGGWVALQLAARGRARTVTALAPAGGWAVDDPALPATVAYFRNTKTLLEQALPYVDQIVATPEGRALATQMYASTAERMPPELLAHQLRGAARCPELLPLIDHAEAHGWNLDAERVTCPVRLVWGTADRVLVPPAAAVRFRRDWLPQADWVEIDGAGHCPQLDHPLETAQLILDFAR
ncbi:MAG: alpha/beta hydrolase [Actinobacteria bacterium]|nr:alpha/beta hydrolase [Actinomycetota bacterium]